ncbi:coth protein-domain-containing protein [Spinellus fusiger]|nr:coth protein-domain-containing protein [Spinellus fusiger]
MPNLYLIFCLLNTLALATEITYNVVLDASNTNSIVGVMTGQTNYLLSPHPTIPMLYTGKGPGGSSYCYFTTNDLHENKNLTFEPFQRPAVLHKSSTFNDFYGRSWNKYPLPVLPQVYNFETKNSRGDPGLSELFEEGMVATLHMEMDEGMMKDMHDKKLSREILDGVGRMTYISYRHIKQFENVKFTVGGHSTRSWAKVPYKIKIPQDSVPEGLFNRSKLKLRSEATDISMVREKTYVDMLQSTGVVASRGAYVRLYINGKPIGLYLLMDDVASEPYARQVLHHGNRDVQLGSLIKGDAGKGKYAANFMYRGRQASSYDSRVYDVKVEAPEGELPAMQSLIQLMKFIDNYDPNMAEGSMALDAWSSVLDIKSFIRQMAMEWIGGHWDGVQYSGNNFALYQYPDTKQYLMIPMDFDFTFGNGLEEDQLQLMSGSWPEFTADRKIHSYLWEKVKATPYLKRFYINTLRDINQKLSNPKILIPRIEAVATMIWEDVLWDQSLVRLSKGYSRPFAGDLKTSLEEASEQDDDLIGLKEWIKEKHEAVQQDTE